MNTVLGPWLRRDRLPVRDATAVSTADRAQRPITLHVGLRRVRGGFDRHRAPLEIHPRAADPAAERAVAGRGGLRRGRQGQPDRAAMTGALVHQPTSACSDVQPAYPRAGHGDRWRLAGPATRQWRRGPQTRPIPPPRPPRPARGNC